MDKLIFEVAAGLESNAHEASFLLDAVATTESAATRTVFSQYSKSADPGVQCVGIAGLIGNAEGGALQSSVGLFSTASRTRDLCFSLWDTASATDRRVLFGNLWRLLPIPTCLST
jgi:hypothetical protein